MEGNQISPLPGSCVDAFFEWQRLECEVEAAVRNCSDRPSAICAGWSVGALEGSQSWDGLLTFTVITADRNEVVEPLHDRAGFSEKRMPHFAGACSGAC